MGKLYLRWKKSCLIEIEPGRKVDIDGSTVDNGANERIRIGEAN